jgi:hypothetical protein
MRILADRFRHPAHEPIPAHGGISQPTVCDLGWGIWSPDSGLTTCPLTCHRLLTSRFSLLTSHLELGTSRFSLGTWHCLGHCNRQCIQINGTDLSWIIQLDGWIDERHRGKRIVNPASQFAQY